MYLHRNMLLQWAEGKNVRIDTNVWYTGEGLKRYLEAGNRLDIELFRMTGIEVGSYIRNQSEGGHRIKKRGA